MVQRTATRRLTGLRKELRSREKKCSLLVGLADFILDVPMKTLFLLLVPLLAGSVVAQTVPIFTADYYRVNPARYVGKEVTLAVAYVMPSDHSREDGMQELLANTYNQNRFGGHIPIIASPEVAKRVAQQCGVQHVWDHSHITLIRGIFKENEAKPGHYCVFVQK